MNINYAILKDNEKKGIYFWKERKKLPTYPTKNIVVSINMGKFDSQQ